MKILSKDEMEYAISRGADITKASLRVGKVSQVDSPVEVCNVSESLLTVVEPQNLVFFTESYRAFSVEDLISLLPAKLGKFSLSIDTEEVKYFNDYDNTLTILSKSISDSLVHCLLSMYLDTILIAKLENICLW